MSVCDECEKRWNLFVPHIVTGRCFVTGRPRPEGHCENAAALRAVTENPELVLKADHKDCNNCAIFDPSTVSKSDEFQDPWWCDKQENCPDGWLCDEW